MLEKTRAMLERIGPSRPVPDGVPCYDEAEIAALGPALESLVYAPPPLRQALQSFGVTVTRADQYSDIPTLAELAASEAQPSRLRLDAPFAEAAFLRDTLVDLTRFGADFDPPASPADECSFTWERGGFSYSDAMAYYCMIRRHRPQTIVEIGCGTSTMVASLACERNGCGRIIAIEPHPPPFLHRLPRVELVTARVQDVDEAFVAAKLHDGDMLFIDTTHAVKHDSDCLHIYLRILPHISHSIFVHAHDIYLPGTLPMHLMRDHQVYWNEQYLLYAYMLGNPRVLVLYGSAYHHQSNPDLLAAFMHGRFTPGGASLWFAQTGADP